MVLLFAIGVVVLIVTLFYVYFTRNNGYWKKHGIPHEEPKFFFGNLSQALTGKVHIHEEYTNLYRKFTDASYFGFYKLHHPAIVIRDLDIIKDVMVKEFNSFADNDFHIDEETDPVLAGNPFIATGEEWKVKRSEWSTGMTSSRVKMMFEVLSDKATLTVEHLREHVKNNPKEPVDVKELSLIYLVDTTVESVLGLRSNSFKDPDNEFINIVFNLFKSDFWTGLQQLCYLIAPWVIKVVGSGFVSKSLVKRLIAISNQVIEIRKKNGFVKNDFFEVLLKKYNVSIMEVTGRVFGFLAEGIESTSVLISYALYELAVNPQMQAKLRKEILDSTKGNDGKLTYEAIHSLPYLDQCVNETLRVHPPVFIMSRVCTKPYELPPATPGGKPFVIPVDMAVTIPTYATAMDPNYFKDPETFDPERFSPENKDDIRKFSYLPFGEGPRICLGQRLGLTNAKNCISNIIKNFEVRLSSKTKTPLQVDPNIFMNRPIGDIWLTFHEISK